MTEREGTNEPGGADEIAAAHDALVPRRDYVSDLAELDSMRLQAAMEQRGKAFQTLSDVVKKTSETQQDIADDLQ